MALLFGHWRPLVMDYDLLHFTIYSCIYPPPAGLLLRLRDLFNHIGTIHRYGNKFLFQIVGTGAFVEQSGPKW